MGNCSWYLQLNEPLIPLQPFWLILFLRPFQRLYYQVRIRWSPPRTFRCWVKFGWDCPLHRSRFEWLLHSLSPIAISSNNWVEIYRNGPISDVRKLTSPINIEKLTMKTFLADSNETSANVLIPTAITSGKINRNMPAIIGSGNDTKMAPAFPIKPNSIMMMPDTFWSDKWIRYSLLLHDILWKKRKTVPWITLLDATLVTAIVPILFEYEVDALPDPQIPLRTQPNPWMKIPRLRACNGGLAVSMKT